MRSNKRAKLTKKDIEFIKNSDAKSYLLAFLFKCSVSAVIYHRRTGIWRKR